MKSGKHRREESTADGPAATQSELVDRSWEAYDAELVKSHSYSGMTKRLPFLFGYFARIAWESSRVNCVVMVVADLVNGSMSAFRLLVYGFVRQRCHGMVPRAKLDGPGAHLSLADCPSAACAQDEQGACHAPERLDQRPRPQ